MPYKSKQAKYPNRVYMTELTAIIDRRADTIRKWDYTGKLPKHLRPKRDADDHRYWSKMQVKGIIKWMDDNDMRPGKLIALPESEAHHLREMRKPKFITGRHLQTIHAMIANGKTYDQIIKKVYPRTEYATVKSFEQALKRLFQMEDWYLPPKPRAPYPPPHLRMGQPGPKPKPGSKAAKRQKRLARRRDKLLMKY